MISLGSFDRGVKEVFVWTVHIPTGTGSMSLRMVCRKDRDASPEEMDARKLYFRPIPKDGPLGAWIEMQAPYKIDNVNRCCHVVTYDIALSESLLAGHTYELDLEGMKDWSPIQYNMIFVSKEPA